MPHAEVFNAATSAAAAVEGAKYDEATWGPRLARSGEFAALAKAFGVSGRSASVLTRIFADNDELCREYLIELISGDLDMSHDVRLLMRPDFTANDWEENCTQLSRPLAVPISLMTGIKYRSRSSPMKLRDFYTTVIAKYQITEWDCLPTEL